MCLINSKKTSGQTDQSIIITFWNVN